MKISPQALSPHAAQACVAKVLVELGISHRRSSLSVLDTVTVRDLGRFYRNIRQIESINGAIILQTCNRVEFYLENKGKADPSDKLLSSWATETGHKPGSLKQLVEMRTDRGVVEHLVRVGTGLESMLIGEPQIMGQMKSALAESEREGASSPLLSEVFDRSVRAASQIRQETGIGKGAVSLGSAAVRVVEAEIGPIQETTVVLVGTGEVGLLMMKALNARKVERVTVAGRNLHRTAAFCRTHGGSPIDLRDIHSILPSADLLILATKAKSPIITAKTLTASLDARNVGNRRLVLLDLSTPRNASPEIDHMPGVVVKTLENIRSIAERSIAKRREIVEQAEPLAAHRALEIVNLLRREEAEPIVSEIYHRADMVRAKELERAVSKLHLTLEERRVLEKMSLSLVEKILGPPTVNLRKAAEKGDRQVLTAAGHIFKSE